MICLEVSIYMTELSFQGPFFDTWLNFGLFLYPYSSLSVLKPQIKYSDSLDRDKKKSEEPIHKWKRS